jgi:hypothetical protein
MSINTSLDLPRLMEPEAPRLVIFKKEADSAARVVSEAQKNDPNYFREVPSRLRFISESFKVENHVGVPPCEAHSVPVRYYPGERLRQVFSVKEDSFEFLDLGKTPDFLSALDEFAQSVAEMRYSELTLLENSLDAKALRVFDAHIKFMSSWGKENGIPGVFVPFQVGYRTTEPYANASSPFHFVHVDYTEELYQYPPEDVKKKWMAAAKYVFGEDMTEAQFDKLKCHDPINIWVPLHKETPGFDTLAIRRLKPALAIQNLAIRNLPTQNTVAIKKDPRCYSRTIFLEPDVPTLAPLYDAQRTWLLQEDSMYGSGVMFRTDEIAHSAVPISSEIGKQHRKSVELRGAFFSSYTEND